MKNIRIIGVLLIAFFVKNAKGQDADCKLLKDHIHNQFLKIDQFNRKSQDSAISMYDSLKPANEQLKKLLVQWIESGGFQVCPLNPVQNMKVVASPDLNLIAISWNTYLGGTLIDFASILGYKNEDGTFASKKMESEFQGITDNDKILIDRIYTIKNKHKQTIYLVSSVGQSGALTPFYNMTAYKIGKAIVETPVFGGKIALSTSFDYTSFHDGTYLPNDFIGIQFLQKGLYVRRPISEKNGIFNGRFEIYKFDGLKYYRIK